MHFDLTYFNNSQFVTTTYHLPQISPKCIEMGRTQICPPDFISNKTRFTGKCELPL